MGFIPQDLAKHSSPYIKGEEFDGAGLDLIVKKFEIITPENPEYGVNDTSFLFKNGKLKVGEAFKYTFESVGADELEDGMNDRIFESTSPGLFIEFSKINPEPGTKVNVRREGKAAKTRYVISIVK